MSKPLRLPDPSQVDELEADIVYMAYVVENFGDIYAPILDRLLAELDALRRQESPRDRARRILNAYTREGGVKAIR